MIARLKDLLWDWRFTDQVGGQLFYLWPKLPKRYDSEQGDYSPHTIFDQLEFYRDGGADQLTFVECDRITFPEGELRWNTNSSKASVATGSIAVISSQTPRTSCSKRLEHD